MSVRADSKKFRHWTIQVVNVAEPHIQSPAAMVLLTKMYFTLDKGIYKESRMTRIRNKWMKQQMKTPDCKGGLTCTLCGRKGLKSQTRDKNVMATLDHIVELKHGGIWDDPTNFRVACFFCNTQRSKDKPKSKTCA